jgi:hypothetical protein
MARMVAVERMALIIWLSLDVGGWRTKV